MVPDNIIEQMIKNQKSQQKYYDQQSINPHIYENGEQMLLQNINTKIYEPAVIIIKNLEGPRLYLLKTKHGKVRSNPQIQRQIIWIMNMHQMLFPLMVPQVVQIQGT